MKASVHRPLLALALLTLANACLKPSGGREGKPGPEFPLGESGDVVFLLNSDVPSDVHRLRLRHCTSAGETCTTDPVEVWSELADVDLDTGLVQSVPVGLTLFELALTNADGRVLGSAKQAYDVKAGTQTLPRFVIKLDQRELVDVELAVPVAPRASGDVTWENRIKSLMTSRGCTACHNGTDQALDNHVRLDLSRYPLKSHTKDHWIMDDVVSESLYRVDEVETPETGRMPPTGARWARADIELLQAWFDAGMPEKTVPELPAAPANVMTLEVDIAETFGGRVLPLTAGKVLTRQGSVFKGDLGELAIGASYRLTVRYYDGDRHLLRAAPETQDVLVGGDKMTAACDFTGVVTDGRVIIPIDVDI